MRQKCNFIAMRKKTSWPWYWVLALLLGSWGGQVRAFDPRAVYHNDRALHYLGEKLSSEAGRSLNRALKVDPANPSLQINLGFVYLLKEDYTNARKQFDLAAEVAKGVSQELEFVALFDAAVAATQEQKIPEALSRYQAALAIKPDSQDVKKNIELLLQGEGKGEGKGQGKGDGKDQNKEKPDDKDNNGEDSEDPKDPGEKPPDQPKDTPAPQDLSKEQIEKIFKELKNQEQKIRADEQSKGRKESPSDKDW